MSGVLKDWVTKLRYQDQCDLMSVLRGIDTGNGEVKKVTKLFRHAILNEADNNKPYFKLNNIDTTLAAKAITEKGHVDSQHWYEHVVKAAYLIRDKCDNIFIVGIWNDIIVKLEKKKLDPPHVTRMLKEYRDLKYKVNKLKEWIDKGNEVDGQVKQLKHMVKYLNILSERLNNTTQ